MMTWEPNIYGLNFSQEKTIASDRVALLYLIEGFVGIVYGPEIFCVLCPKTAPIA